MPLPWPRPGVTPHQDEVITVASQPPQNAFDHHPRMIWNVLEGMSLSTFPDSSETLGLLLAESRVLSAVAGDAVLRGSADELIRQLAVGRDIFRVAVQDLVEGGWIFATSSDDGRMVIGRERRRRNVGPPSTRERRHATSIWEGAETH